MYWAKINKLMTSLSQDRNGAVAATYAVLLVPLLLAVGLATDMNRAESQRQDLQALADNAALQAAQELALVGTTQRKVAASASAYVQGFAKDKAVTVDATVDLETRTVSVTLGSSIEWLFPFLSGEASPYSVFAQAQLVGETGNLCMIGLDPTIKGTLTMSRDAKLTAEDCSVYSNSSSASSLIIKNGARVTADLVCVSGGIEGDQSKITAEITEDCPQIEDPLRDRAKPFQNGTDVGRKALGIPNALSNVHNTFACDHLGTIVLPGQDVTLEPGIYCGGISVLGGTAELEPGEYIMKDGGLRVAAGGMLTGENVGFFLTGALSTISFQASATIDLTAPTDGILAGMLFFEDPLAAVSTHHLIGSDNARRLVGTIYIPMSKLRVEGRDPIAEDSEYTIIVAREFELRDGPNLVLNANYDSSDIPVPVGVGPVNNPDVRLIR